MPSNLISAAPRLLVSVYLITGGRLCDRNLAILAAIGASVASRGLPFIIAGDFQVVPHVLQATAFATCLGAVTIAPACPLGTRVRTSASASRVIDYFVVSEGLSAAALGATPVPEWPGKRRRLVTLRLRADHERLQVLRFTYQARHQHRTALRPVPEAT